MVTVCCSMASICHVLKGEKYCWLSAAYPPRTRIFVLWLAVFWLALHSFLLSLCLTSCDTHLPCCMCFPLVVRLLRNGHLQYSHPTVASKRRVPHAVVHVVLTCSSDLIGMTSVGAGEGVRDNERVHLRAGLPRHILELQRREPFHRATGRC